MADAVSVTDYTAYCENSKNVLTLFPCSGLARRMEIWACPIEMLLGVFKLRDICLDHYEQNIYCRDQDSNLGYCGHNAMY